MIDNGAVLALVNRLLFFARYAQQFVPELFSRKSILKLASSHPLIVDEKVPVAELTATLLAEHPNALVECFVVTARGRYLGVGTGEALLRADLVAECLRLMRGRAQEGGLRLSHEIASAMPNLIVDRLRLKQVLLNLLSNAIKFTPRGGRVHVEAFRPRWSPSARSLRHSRAMSKAPA